MNEDKSSSSEERENQSSLGDLRDWDVLSESDIVASKKDTVLSESITEEQKSPSGLFTHGNIHCYSGVEELVIEHSESNSSSDIDIIDEDINHLVDDDINHLVDDDILDLPKMDFSFCSTSDISSSVAEEATTHEEEEEARPVETTPPSSRNQYFEYFIQILRVVVDGVVSYYREGLPIKELFVLGIIATICISLTCIQFTLFKTTMHNAKMEKLEVHVNKLMTENEHLKSKVLAKIEGGKLFGELDEGVRDLKSENYKLHRAMERVIEQLEEQTEAIRRGEKGVKGDPYRKEIMKLKEQINLLRIDNEELQKQLVRIRYGKHPPHAENRDTLERSSVSEYGQNKDQQLEIQELRRKLDEEVAKLKHWKDSIEDFVKEIERPEGKDDRHKHRGEKKKKSEDKYKKHKRFYNWSWKEIKNNFKGTLENFPRVSDMISKYVLFDKKKVEGILDAICHYYKKAQDKTQKILESYSVDEKTQNVKNDIWTLMGEMKSKWVLMKNDFLKTHFGQPTDKREAEPKMDDQEVRSADDDEPPTDDAKEEAADKEEEDWDMRGEVDELLREAQRRFTQQETNINSWMFERAQHRAELRDHESPDDEENNNWFLRRNKNDEHIEESPEEKYFEGNQN